MPPSGSSHEASGRRYLDVILRGAPNIVLKKSKLQYVTKEDENGTYKSFVEKGADTALSTDMIESALVKQECDVVILVSSDGDFAPPVEKLREYDVRVEVVYFKDRRPFVMENLSVMREFRQSYLQEMDKPRPMSKRRFQRAIGVQ